MLSLYEPKLEDLWFRAELMGDPETMSYNHAQGGTLPFPKEKWSAWYHKWIVQHGGQRGLHLSGARGGVVDEKQLIHWKILRVTEILIHIIVAVREKSRWRRKLYSFLTTLYPRRG